MYFFFQAEDGIRDHCVTGVQTCALPICSSVAFDRMRFDFSHPKALTHDDIQVVEDEVNNRIRRNAEVTTRLMTPDRATEAGALALFGEKYGDEVRVVAMGDIDEDAKRPYSIELCGGTHVRRTGDIGLAKIVSESAVAAGGRRNEGLTGAGGGNPCAAGEKSVGPAAARRQAAPARNP